MLHLLAVNRNEVSWTRDIGGLQHLGMGENLTRGQQVFLLVAIYQGSILGTYCLTHAHVI